MVITNNIKKGAYTTCQTLFLSLMVRSLYSVSVLCYFFIFLTTLLCFWFSVPFLQNARRWYNVHTTSIKMHKQDNSLSFFQAVSRFGNVKFGRSYSINFTVSLADMKTETNAWYRYCWIFRMPYLNDDKNSHVPC